MIPSSKRKISDVRRDVETQIRYGLLDVRGGLLQEPLGLVQMVRCGFVDLAGDEDQTLDDGQECVREQPPIAGTTRQLQALGGDCPGRAGLLESVFLEQPVQPIGEVEG